MEDIRIHVPAVPVAQPRPRAARICGHATIVSNPAKHPVTAYKATCRMAAAQAYSGPPLSGPLSVTILCVLPRPASMVWKLKAMPRMPHPSRPDLDNLAKSTIDALAGLLWVNDSQIWDLRLRKVIAAGDEQPHVELVVWEGE